MVNFKRGGENAPYPVHRVARGIERLPLTDNVEVTSFISADFHTVDFRVATAPNYVTLGSGAEFTGDGEFAYADLRLPTISADSGEWEEVYEKMDGFVYDELGLNKDLIQTDYPTDVTKSGRVMTPHVRFKRLFETDMSPYTGDDFVEITRQVTSWWDSDMKEYQLASRY